MAGAKGKGSGVSKTVKSAERQERLAAALRENLRRRKAGARPAQGPAAPASGEDAPVAPNPPPDRPKNAPKSR